MTVNMIAESHSSGRRIVPSRALPQPHFRYSPVVQAGPFVFISGMVALDPDTGKLAQGDASAQTAQILSNLNRLLAEQGWAVEQLILARIFYTGADAFAGANSAWEAFFADHSPPARTSAGVSLLPLGALVEIEFQLYIEAPALNGG